LGAICTLGIFSILYKENPFYRLFEHIFIGLAAGQGIYVVYAEYMKPVWQDPMIHMGQWWWALAIVPGAMFYFIYSKQHAWLSRLIFGAFFGFGCGLVFQGFANGTFPQVAASFKSVVPGQSVSWTTAFNNMIFVAVLVTVMAYFFFSVDHKAKSMRASSALGRWFLMFAFGAMFGSTVMARMALFIGRLDFMTRDWGPIVPMWFWAVLGGLLALIIGYFIFKPKPPKKLRELPIEEEPEEEAVAEGEPS
jgi:hypothetical protein